MEPTKIITIAYNTQPFEHLPTFIQEQVGTPENWARIQRECKQRGDPADQDLNSHTSLLTLKEIERREWNAQPRYKDSQSALQAMKQYLEARPPFPAVLGGESVKEHQARFRQHCEMRRQRAVAAAVVAARGDGGSRLVGERAGAGVVVAGVESALLAHVDVGSGRRDGEGKVIEAGGKGSMVAGVVGGGGKKGASGAKAREEDGWVVVSTDIVGSKCPDDDPSSVESESEWDQGSDEESEEEDDTEEEALYSIAAAVPR